MPTSLSKPITRFSARRCDSIHKPSHQGDLNAKWLCVLVCFLYADDDVDCTRHLCVENIRWLTLSAGLSALLIRYVSAWHASSLFVAPCTSICIDIYTSTISHQRTKGGPLWLVFSSVTRADQNVDSDSLAIKHNDSELFLSEDESACSSHFCHICL